MGPRPPRHPRRSHDRTPRRVRQRSRAPILAPKPVPDLRLALRLLAKSPGFTCLTLLTLALGIGATTAIFTVVNSVLLRPVEYPQSESLMVIRQSKLPQFPSFSVCPADFYDFKTEADLFENMYATRNASYIMTGQVEPRRLRGLRATAGYFDTLRVHPTLGRAFHPAEDTEGNNRVIVLSHSFWQSEFDGRETALGSVLTLDHESYEIIGVMPESFRRGVGYDFFTPMALESNQRVDRGAHYVSVVGRIKPGVTFEQANAQLMAVAAQLAIAFPDTNAGWSAYAVPILEWNTGDARATLYTLMGAVAVLMLIVCANVGNLMMVRATGRQGEISVRAALGASGWDIARLLLAESIILGLIGGGLGLLIASWGLDALMALGADIIPRALEVQLDGRALAFTVALSVISGVAFGLAPIWQSRRLNLNDALKAGTRGGIGSERMQIFRHVLVAAEIALALILLNSAGLLGRSFMALAHVDPGFNAKGAWWLNLSVPDTRYDTEEKQAAFAEQVKAKIAQIPGIKSTAYTTIMPFTGADYVLDIEFPDRVLAPGDEVSAVYFPIGPDYFGTMGTPLLRGRDFTPADRAGAPRVAIVSETFARMIFPGEDVIGRRVHITNSEAQVWREIVGVVPDVKQFGLDQVTGPQIYEPFAQQPHSSMSFIARTEDDAAPLGLAQALRQAVYTVDANQPVFNVSPVEDLVADSLADREFSLLLLLVFASVALLLSAIGTYGVMAHTVAQRTREYGLRMALGALPRQVLTLVFSRGVKLIAWGLIFGAAGSLASAHLIKSQLHQTSPHDPLVLMGVATILIVSAAAACFISARRATRVDPMIALHSE